MIANLLLVLVVFATIPRAERLNGPTADERAYWNQFKLTPEREAENRAIIRDYRRWFDESPKTRGSYDYRPYPLKPSDYPIIP